MMNPGGIANFSGSRQGIILAGAVIGLLSSLLHFAGNPAPGLCVICHIRDIAGALGFHRADGGQSIRPEIIGLVLGSTLSALAFGEFKPRGGAAPMVRFMLGVFAAAGALVFTGCPFGTLLRLSGGNINAIPGMLGLAAGVYAGVRMVRGGFFMGRSVKTQRLSGWIMPGAMLVLLVILVFNIRVNDNSAPFWSWFEPSSLHAPTLIALFAGIIIGFLAQRTRFCTIGAIRDLFLIRNGHYMYGVLAMVVSAFAANLALGQFSPSLPWMAEPAPTANQYIWGTAGMVLAGFAFTLAGGCAGRHLFLAGEGDGDAAVFILGMLCGTAILHNFGILDRPACGIAADLDGYGKLLIISGLVFCTISGLCMKIDNQTRGN